MRALLALTLALAPFSLSACDSTGGGGDGGVVRDMAIDPNADFAGQIVDFAMNTPADLSGKKTIVIGWQLISKNKQGEPGNGFNVKCDESGVGKLAFTVTNSMTKASVTTEVACPAGKTIDESTIEIPDATGPFEVCGAAVGKPASNSDKVSNVMPSTNISVRVYVEGCNQANCCM